MNPRSLLAAAVIVLVLIPWAGPDRSAFAKGEPKPDDAARRAAQRQILAEIKQFAPAKHGDVAGLAAFNVGMLPNTGADLKPYADDAQNPFAMKPDAVPALREKFPLRAKVWEVADRLNEHIRLPMDESLEVAAGPITAQDKKRFLTKLKDPALAVFELEELLEDMKKLADHRDKETKRWQAHYDLATARLLTRLIYLYEYNGLLAQVRSDSLPPLDEEKHVGFRVEATGTMQTREFPVRKLAKETVKTWDRILADHPGTPWAAVAERERDRPPGLHWVPILRTTLEK